jgi:hypothetical protein
MGNDFYCALCAVHVREERAMLGNETEVCREIRRKYIEMKLNPSEDDDLWFDPLPAMPADSDDEEGYPWDEVDATMSYDPDLLLPRDLDWLRTLHCLGFNMDAAGTSK